MTQTPTEIRRANGDYDIDISRSDPRFHALMDFAMRQYFLDERVARECTWSEVKWNPNGGCFCYSCQAQKNRNLDILHGTTNADPCE